MNIGIATTDMSLAREQQAMLLASTTHNLQASPNEVVRQARHPIGSASL
jgi:hypothetical protein